MRSMPLCTTALFALLAFATPSTAQDSAFGIGARFAFIRGDVDTDSESERFIGGQVRLKMSPRLGLELSLDVRNETNEALTLRSREYPLQASLMLFPINSRLAPYVLGGGGWYSVRLQTLEDDKVTSSETVRDFGYHAGFGAELRFGRHAGAHADYRYTFIDFGSDDPEPPPPALLGFPSVGSLLPSYKGSMWTAGLTIYF